MYPAFPVSTTFGVNAPPNMSVEGFADAANPHIPSRKDYLFRKDHLRDVLADLRRWRHAARCRPLDQLLWEIYQESGYLAYCQGLPNGQQRAANLMLRGRSSGPCRHCGSPSMRAACWRACCAW